MSRYDTIKKEVFGNQEIHWDANLIQTIIESLNFSNGESIHNFRNLVTLFVTDLDNDKYASYDDRRFIIERMNFKIRSILGKNLSDLYDKCVNIQKFELWLGDELYKAFSFDIVDPHSENSFYIGKPTYVMCCLKSAILLNDYIHRDVSTVSDLVNIHNLFRSSLDEHIFQCFGSYCDRSVYELNIDSTMRDEWIDLLLSRKYLDAYHKVYNRIQEYRLIRKDCTLFI